MVFFLLEIKNFIQKKQGIVIHGLGQLIYASFVTFGHIADNMIKLNFCSNFKIMLQGEKVVLTIHKFS